MASKIKTTSINQINKLKSKRCLEASSCKASSTASSRNETTGTTRKFSTMANFSYGQGILSRIMLEFCYVLCLMCSGQTTIGREWRCKILWTKTVSSRFTKGMSCSFIQIESSLVRITTKFTWQTEFLQL